MLSHNHRITYSIWPSRSSDRKAKKKKNSHGKRLWLFDFTSPEKCVPNLQRERLGSLWLTMFIIETLLIRLIQYNSELQTFRRLWNIKPSFSTLHGCALLCINQNYSVFRPTLIAPYSFSAPVILPYLTPSIAIRTLIVRTTVPLTIPYSCSTPSILPYSVTTVPL